MSAMRVWNASRVAVLFGVGFIGRAFATDATVQLPPFIVEDQLAGRPWRYAAIEGFEVLSRCHDTKTKDLVRAYVVAHRKHHAVLPARYVMRSDVPIRLILYDESAWPVETQEAVAAMLRARTELSRPRHDGRSAIERLGEVNPAFRTTVFEGPRVVTSLPRRQTPVFLRDVRLSDADTTVIFTLAPPGHNDVYASYLRPSYLADLMWRRAPSLPVWFVTGFLELYETMEFAENTITLPPLVWLSPDESKQAAANSRQVREALLPMADVLEETDTSGAPLNLERRRLATAQRALFLRWALDPNASERGERFWRFLDRAVSERLTEESLREAFGKSSDQINDELADMLPAALRRPVVWRIDLPDMADVNLRDATAAEIARLKGDWERLEVLDVRARAPELEEKYRSNALRTLRRGMRSGADDPRLLAVLGLAELEAGNAGRARVHLDAAAKAGVVRPRIYLELARVDFDQLTALGPREDRTDYEWARRILALLDQAMSQAPPLPGAYRLYAEVWEHAKTLPDEAVWTVIDKGCALFPRDGELLLRAASCQRAHGFIREARERVEQALRLELGDPLRVRLERLREELAQ